MASTGDRECCAPAQSFEGSDLLADYRAYIVDEAGHFRDSVSITAADDEAAVAAARPLVDGHDVEVWLRDRKVAVLKHEPGQT